MDDHQRQILHELDERKARKDRPCRDCHGTGKLSKGDEFNLICYQCLGQGIELMDYERQVILEVAGYYKPDPTDAILDHKIIE